MNVLTEQSNQVDTGSNRSRSIVIRDVAWGYTIQKGGKTAKYAAWGEIAAILASIAFGIAAYCQWLLPGTINSIEVLPFKIVGTLIFFVFAFMTYSIARRGLMNEVQVDEQRQVVRLVRRNRDGMSSLSDLFTFAEINRVFMKRSKTALTPAQLYIEPRKKGRPILIASGNAAELDVLRERMIADLNPQQMQGSEASNKGAQPGVDQPPRRALAI